MSSGFRAALPIAFAILSLDSRKIPSCAARTAQLPRLHSPSMPRGAGLRNRTQEARPLAAPGEMLAIPLSAH